VYALVGCSFYFPLVLPVHPAVQGILTCNGRAGGMAQVAEHLPSKHGTFTSNSRTTKNKTKMQCRMMGSGTHWEPSCQLFCWTHGTTEAPRSSGKVVTGHGWLPGLLISCPRLPPCNPMGFASTGSPPYLLSLGPPLPLPSILELFHSDHDHCFCVLTCSPQALFLLLVTLLYPQFVLVALNKATHPGGH
jgi:hypothetical protein